MNLHKITLEYLHSKLNFFIDPSLSIDNIFNFFSTHFFIKKDTTEDNPLANVYVVRDSSEFENINFDNGEDIYIRKSASDFFTIPGKRVSVGGIEYIKCIKTDTLLLFDSINKKIVISTQLKDTEQDELVFIEIIRDLILKNEENHGVVVLHATSALKDGKASLLIGSKGKGKSTLLLELVNELDYKLISGDKTFLWINEGKLMCAGWPDYPHLGLGTLSKYPAFVEHFRLRDKIEAVKEDLWSTEHKMAIDPKFFQEMIPFADTGLSFPVENIIYPNLFPTNECEVLQISNHMEMMKPHIERIFVKGNVIWNNFIKPKNQSELEMKIDDCINLANEIRAYEINGSGILEDSLFSKGYGR
ncbi:hypothetical protein [Priestia filamentosa]|uniref:hypothetical protein n=1 Tax=Priestia filamentosa TaxID=1402861 RepID=UPI003982857C